MGALIRQPALWLTALLLLLWSVPAFAATSTGHVSWIYDGDTIKVDGIGKVRLIGVDTPEQKDSPRDNYYRNRYQIPASQLRKIARDALAFNIEHVKDKRVRLAYDEHKHDKFGRTLAYVYLPDGTLLNRLLIEKGLGSVYRRFDFRLKQDFIAAEEKAQQSGIGLWTNQSP